MKVLILSGGIFLLFCGILLAEQQPIDPPGKNEMEWDKNDKENFLIPGDVTREEILSLKVYQFYYVEYIPKSDPVEKIHNVSEPADIFVLFGDWCKDSKKHVPGLIKILEFADNDRLNVRFVNVTPDKHQPAELLEGKNVSSVPTIIVSRGGSEIGRIVENPKLTIEEDLVAILNSH